MKTQKGTYMLFDGDMWQPYNFTLPPNSAGVIEPTRNQFTGHEQQCCDAELWGTHYDLNGGFEWQYQASCQRAKGHTGRHKATYKDGVGRAKPTMSYSWGALPSDFCSKCGKHLRPDDMDLGADTPTHLDCEEA